jgi:hypothetical protein
MQAVLGVSPKISKSIFHFGVGLNRGSPAVNGVPGRTVFRYGIFHSSR